MRILLAVLMCFVLLRTECKALHVSHDGGGAGLIPVTGNYAGVMLPFDPNMDPDAKIDINFPEFFNSANVLAVFTLTVPQTGMATGDLLIFSDGRAFIGDISGFGDTGNGRIFGVLDANFEPLNNNSDLFVVFFTLSSVDAAGRFAAAVVPDLNVFSSSLGRLTGKAHIDVTTTGDQLVVNNPGPDGIPDSGDETSSFKTVLTQEASFDLFIDGVKQSG